MMPRTAGQFGKQPYKQDDRTLELKKYLFGTLPKVPIEVNRLAEVYTKIGINDPKVLFIMD
jgi:hypothetical protein